MAEEWFIAHEGQKRGPLTLDALLDLFYRGDVRMSDLVWSPALDRWTRAADCDAVTRGFVERDARERRAGGAVPLTVLRPPPGEPWFYPVSPVLVGLMDVASWGLYTLVWGYRHRVWALRRAGLPTSPIGIVYRGEFPLALELARAAEAIGLRHDIAFRPETSGDVFLGLVAYFCLWPLYPLFLAVADMDLQRAANRVNRAVAPRSRAARPGWPELVVLLMGLSFWALLALGLAARLG